jgi:hypothetical protein
MVAASSQVLPDKQGSEEQRQHTQEAEAAKVTKPWGTAGGGRWFMSRQGCQPAALDPMGGAFLIAMKAT